MIEISETSAKQFISNYHASECRVSSAPVDIDGNTAYELTQILLVWIITLQEKLIFEHEVNSEPNLVRKLLLDYFGRVINFHEMTVGILWVLATSEKNISK